VIPYGKLHPVAVRWGNINSYTGPLNFVVVVVVVVVVVDNDSCAGVICPMRAQSTDCQPIKPPGACCSICGR